MFVASTMYLEPEARYPRRATLSAGLTPVRLQGLPSTLYQFGQPAPQRRPEETTAQPRHERVHTRGRETEAKKQSRTVTRATPGLPQLRRGYSLQCDTGGGYGGPPLHQLPATAGGVFQHHSTHVRTEYEVYYKVRSAPTWVTGNSAKARHHDRVRARWRPRLPICKYVTGTGDPPGPRSGGSSHGRRLWRAEQANCIILPSPSARLSGKVTTLQTHRPAFVSDCPCRREE